MTELWSPVRAVALYLKLELPLRTFQVRMLDSGEADTWRYVHDPRGGSFEPNDVPFSTGSATRPYQRGVFHRHVNESGVGLFINTNKTADINKAENAKGYVIPWAHETVLYWLAKLRCWQERYNPINEPMAWAALEAKHFGCTPPHPEVLEARGSACFLFRDAAAKHDDRQKPLGDNSLSRIWYRLLARLEQCCLARDETLDGGTPIQFVDHDRDQATYFPLHALRVSLISYLILDLQLPLVVVSKLIAGHSRVIMTLYYTKFGHAYMKEVLNVAERNTLAIDEASHRRFLMDASMEQVSQRFASVSVDAMRAAVGHKSAATFVFEDKGLCPVGGSMCDAGGACIKERQTEPTYAPVPGYPNERNCVRCRFFLSGPAFLPGLQAHFNTVSYEAHERSERHNDLQEQVSILENRRADCQRDGHLFTEARLLERLSQRYEAESEAMGKLVNDMQATYYLIARSMEIMKEAHKEGGQLVAVGEMHDIQMGFTETASELHQLEVLCENATIYPEIDARKPTLRRSQLLDCMLEFNKMPPIFFRLTPEQQLAAGNAVMQLIQARTGSIKGALECVEGHRRLRDLGIVDDTWDVLAEKVAGTPAYEIIDAARVKRTLPHPKGDSSAS
ncbi:gamma-mobile-trio integrase GmtZ [Uliginosibacterium gangwonense]|uniref:gamma-mobile-trio integrase GmtZ n=1 Tax=Uliginosibacterium gangwonense TaxID=392736 RepID=UPI001B7F7CC9|nr:VPA1269 family protein [Uliginosibacterium gangwonense]